MRKFLTSVIVALALVTGGIVTAAPAQAAPMYSATVGFSSENTVYLWVLPELASASAFQLVTDPLHGTASLTPQGTLNFIVPPAEPHETLGVIDTFRIRAVDPTGTPFEFDVTFRIRHHSTLKCASSVITAPVGTPIDLTCQVASQSKDLSGRVHYSYSLPDWSQVQLGSANVSMQGTADITTVTLPQGTYQIYARYSGNNDSADSSVGFEPITITQLPVQAQTTTSLVTSTAGDITDLTVTVEPSAAAGTVTFADADKELGR
ncbi:Ig-like domain repeat protein [Leucobacter salsicius]|uniref:Ig-like domain repeat protein n=1 Tax=Leucobacter salsicius TaxID=664638 RepID=UPI0009FE218A|nr:Ig-like domain repeat protein [Leucobacter salsicius]